jgi:bifunctional non-homologous end joining protein LigD
MQRQWMRLRRNDPLVYRVCMRTRLPPALRGTRNKEPSFISPMLAKLVGAPPTSGEWLTELKLDGHRALAIRGAKQTRLISRNANNLSGD